MLERVKVLTKVQMGWGEVPVTKEAPVQVTAFPVTTRVGTAMSLGELLYWALMGEGMEAGIRG